MAHLSDYISELLFLHNCVIVPRLGGFVADYAPARIDIRREVVYPPSKVVAFNNALQHDDGLLINYVAHKRELTYTAAATWVANQVKDIKHTLVTDGLVILKGLGAFYLDENQQFQFRVDLEDNLLGDAYGLRPVRLPFSAPQQVANTLKTVPIQQNQGFMINKKTLRRVAAILGPILIIAALIPIGTSYLKNNRQEAGIPVKEQSSASQSKDTSQVNEIATQKKQALYYNEKAPAYIYHIIAGSYKARKNARKLAEKLRAKGNNATILEENGKFRVSLQKFSDRYKALQRLDMLRETTDKTYWLHKAEK